MKKNERRLSLIVMAACVAVFFGSTCFANIPAPPVNQDIGFADIAGLGALEEEDCRACHPGMPDRHHLLYGDLIPDPSLVPIPDADGDGSPDTNYGCLNCHGVVGTDPIEFDTERDCLVCHTGDSPHHTTADAVAGDCVSCHGDVVDNFDDGHTIPTYSPSLVTPRTQSTECQVTGGPCADDSYCTEDVCVEKEIACVVDDDCDVPVCATSKNPCPAGNSDCVPGHCSDTGLDCYLDDDCPTGSCRGEELCLDSLVDTCGSGNEPCVRTLTHEAGGCSYCHNEGTDTGSGLDIINNHDTHHATYQHNLILPTETNRCYTCHTTGDYHSTNIRKCETCHGYESLHNIAADSDDAGTEIIVGTENPGYSHVGSGDDCFGCHGFSSANAPGTGPITPSISSADVSTMAAGANTAVTLTGAAFTNVGYTSDVSLTAADGSSVALTPDIISQGAMTVTIPGSIDTGNYNVQAVKGDVASNPVVLSVVPDVEITDVSCSEGILTITGSGFGDAPPEGAGEYINVEVDGVPVEIISWTDTAIEAAVASCSGTVTVNALYGSDTSGDDCQACNADVNQDGTVDLFDLIILIGEFLRGDCATNPCQADCNDDGSVDFWDLIVMKIEFLQDNCCIE